MQFMIFMQKYKNDMKIKNPRPQQLSVTVQ